MGGCTHCHRGNPNTERERIAHQGLIEARFARFRFPESAPVRKGDALWKSFACRRCHRIGGRGNRLAVSLDRPLREMDAGNLEQALAEPALYMPDFRFTSDQRTALVIALLARSAGSASRNGPQPKVVHFRAGEEKKPVFARECGGCHRVLSSQSGGLGEGKEGPNLSGLFSRFYPRTFPRERAWTPERLRRWLKNPRDIRPRALMPPVRLLEKDLNNLLKTWKDGDSDTR
jgi:cytochrome c2